MSTKKSQIIERLNSGETIIGDGGMVFMMEKRGYLKLGPATPEVCVEHPSAVREAHIEFCRAGADVIQAFTFYATEDKLSNRGNAMDEKYGVAKINGSACKICREVANEYNVPYIASISQTPTYLTTRNEEAVKKLYREQIEPMLAENVDLLLCEYYEYVEEIKWAIEVGKEFGLPIAATICMGPLGDNDGKSAEEVACIMVRAGAEIIGVNCHFGPVESLDAMQLMINGIKKAGLSSHFMVQPLAYFTPDASRQGFVDLPDFPFAMEPRCITRWDAQKYARRAYNMGIRYIGGCCGFEPYHIRAISEELSPERNGRLGAASEKHEMWGGGLAMHTKPWVIARARREHWENHQPATGRPFSPTYSTCDNWGCVAGEETMHQKTEKTSHEDMVNLSAFKKCVNIQKTK